MISIAEVLSFPKSVGKFFDDLDESRIIKGNVVTDENKFKMFCAALQNINEYGRLRGSPIRINCDDPRVHYENHCLLIHFDTSTFEDEQAKVFVRIIENFDSIDFLSDENGDISTLLLMEGIYKEA